MNLTVSRHINTWKSFKIIQFEIFVILEHIKSTGTLSSNSYYLLIFFCKNGNVLINLIDFQKILLLFNNQWFNNLID